MEALYNRAGSVHAWIQLDTGRIYGLSGQNLAFVDGNSVYDWNGRHISWWQDGHIRDRTGAAALFTANAEHLGVVKPVRKVRPVQPVRAVSQSKPVKQVKPVRPVKRLAWADELPF